MNYNEKFTQLASLIGEPARARMLWHMLEGRAFTATELAVLAGISAQSASNHLNKLMDGGLLKSDAQGRHRYYSFNDKNVAYAIEALANLIPEYDIKKMKRNNDSPKEIFFARTCYDHLAGRLAVNITEKLLGKKLLTLDDEVFDLTKSGELFLQDLGINIDEAKRKRRAFSRPCMDWTERRYHIGGSLGAELLTLMIHKDWIKKVRNSREVILTHKGSSELEKYFGINI